MTAMTAKAELTVQAWGNSLAVRIPAAVARAAHLAVGQPVAVEVADGVVTVKPTGKPQLTLAQKLKAFDPALHGGEAMACGRAGAETF